MNIVPNTLPQAIAFVDELGRATLHGPLPATTTFALWSAAAILAAHIKGRTTGPVLLDFKPDVSRVREYAVRCHRNVNQRYGDEPYEVHLQSVVNAARSFNHLIPSEWHTLAYAGAWVHDVIEDTGQSYNDVAKVCGEAVAEIAYRLTNEKGRNRAERANETYYMGIVAHPVAHYVKLCDRIANITHSKAKGSTMIDRYTKEQPEFSKHLYNESYKAMFEHMETLLYGAPLARMGF